MKVYNLGLIAASLVLVACEGQGTPEASTTANDTVAAVTVQPASTRGLKIQTGPALADNAPDFATLYPEAELVRPALNASENNRLGGMAEFVTDASVDEVITHYRQLAETAGLAVVMEMNQGNARAIGARDNKHSDLQIVASPDEDQRTSVQLTWQAPKAS